MSKPLNTSFETALRILLLLSSNENSRMSIDKIVICDFMTLYGKNFGLADYNLHGDNSLFLGEYTLKRKRVSEAIDILTQYGYISAEYDVFGIMYSITESGLIATRSLSNSYALAYSSLAQNTLAHCHEKSEAELLQELYAAMMQSQRR